jgi:hypothetical protein
MTNYVIDLDVIIPRCYCESELGCVHCTYRGSLGWG